MSYARSARTLCCLPSLKKDLAMLNIVRIFPVLLLWATVASVSFFNVEVVCAQKSALEQVTIQLRGFHQFQFAGHYAAIEKGFYADEGLQVSLREFEPGKDRIAPILEGKAQYGVGGPSLLKIRTEGHPVVVLAQIFQHSPSVLIALKESGIFSPYELVNKKMMLPSGRYRKRPHSSHDPGNPWRYGPHHSCASHLR